jgi:uncharacterized membrane protein YdbT with pleckstrin-like domain
MHDFKGQIAILPNAQLRFKELHFKSLFFKVHILKQLSQMDLNFFVAVVIGVDNAQELLTIDCVVCLIFNVITIVRWWYYRWTKWNQC